MSRLPGGGGGQRHVEYDLPDSCSSSSVGLPPIHLRGNLPHSQSWTVVPEFNMSLRQQREVDPFEYWKYDLQSQIAKMGEKLQESLDQYPDPSTRYHSANVSSTAVAPDFESRKAEHLQRQTRTITNSLAYGLGRK